LTYIVPLLFSGPILDEEGNGLACGGDPINGRKRPRDFLLSIPRGDGYEIRIY